jgi:hypothetical protein
MQTKDHRLTEKLTLQADRELVAALQRRQVEHEQQTGVRASLSAIVISAIKQGLQRTAAAA